MNLTFSPSQILLYGIAIAAGLIYFPYIFVAFGRVSIGYDMNSPRAMFDRLPDYAKRATWAHQNSFEVFALFAAAALTAYVSNVASDQTSLYVLVFLAVSNICKNGLPELSRVEHKRQTLTRKY